MNKNTLNEIHRMGIAFAEHPRGVQAISLDAWNNLKEVNAHFIRTGVGPVYEIVMESLGTCSDFDFVSVKLTDMGLAHFENRHNTPDQGVTSECCTGRLRLLGPYNVLQQEFQIIKAGKAEMEWRPVPTVEI
jgi:hypothetical protein